MRDEFPNFPAWKCELSESNIHCLQLVDLRRPLLSSRHIRWLMLEPSIPGQSKHGHRAVLRCDNYQAILDELTRQGRAVRYSIAGVDAA